MKYRWRQRGEVAMGNMGSRGVTAVILLLVVSFLPGLAQGRQNGRPKKPPHKAEAGQSPRELHALALMYFNGTMVKHNEKEAARLMLLAAEKGHVPSMYYLGVFYHAGMGLGQDRLKSVEWLRKAAERGYGDAQYALALVLLSDDGVTASRQEAVEWLGKAAGQGDPAAAEFLQQLVAYRGPETDTEAEIRALPPPELRRGNGQESPLRGRGLTLDQGSFSLKFSLPEVDRSRPYEPPRGEERLLERLQGGKVELIIPIGSSGSRNLKGDK